MILLNGTYRADSGHIDFICSVCSVQTSEKKTTPIWHQLCCPTGVKFLCGGKDCLGKDFLDA